MSDENEEEQKVYTDARINVYLDVNAADVAEALNYNDGLIMAFVWELLTAAESSELLADLRERIDDELKGAGS